MCGVHGPSFCRRSSRSSRPFTLSALPHASARPLSQRACLLSSPAPPPHPSIHTVRLYSRLLPPRANGTTGRTACQGLATAAARFSAGAHAPFLLGHGASWTRTATPWLTDTALSMPSLSRIISFPALLDHSRFYIICCKKKPNPLFPLSFPPSATPCLCIPTATPLRSLSVFRPLFPTPVLS